MKVQRFYVDMDKKDSIYYLLSLGDIHFGSVACDRLKLVEAVDLIDEDPYYLTIGIGDYFENNSVNGRGPGGVNKHFDIDNLAISDYPTIEEEMRGLKPYWDRIRSKCLGMHIGNHEDRTLTHDGFRLQVCENWKQTYLGDLAYTILTFVYRKQPVANYTIISSHGSNIKGQKLGTVLNAAHAKFTQYQFDVALFGHTHFAGLEKFHTGFVEYQTNEAPTYLERKHIIANTGAFVRSHMEDIDLYTDKAFGSLRNKGTVTISFDPYNRDFNGLI